MVPSLLFEFACLWLYWKLHIFPYVCLLLCISYFVNHLFMSFAHLSSLVLSVFIISFRSSLCKETINPMSCGRQIFFVGAFAFSFQKWLSFFNLVFFILILLLHIFLNSTSEQGMEGLWGLASSTSNLATLPTKIHALDTLNYHLLQMKRNSLMLLGLNTSAQNALPATINRDNI